MIYGNLSAIVERANEIYRNVPGFLGASMEGDNRIKYSFNSMANAETFEGNRSLEMQGSGVTFSVEDCDVIETR